MNKKSPQCYKACLYDLDGTLLNTRELILSSSRHCTEVVLGKTFSEEFYTQRIGTPLEEIMKTFTDDPELQEKCLLTYRAHNEKAHDALVREYAGVSNLLNAVHQAGLLQAVVTSKRSALAWRGLELFGYDRHMEFLIGPDTCAKHKPDPTPVLLAAERMDLDPGECLYIGDSPFDMQAGHGAGCLTVGVSWGFFDAALLKESGADVIVDDANEILDILGIDPDCAFAR